MHLWPVSNHDLRMMREIDTDIFNNLFQRIWTFVTFLTLINHLLGFECSNVN